MGRRFVWEYRLDRPLLFTFTLTRALSLVGLAGTTVTSTRLGIDIKRPSMASRVMQRNVIADSDTAWDAGAHRKKTNERSNEPAGFGRIMLISSSKCSVRGPRGSQSQRGYWSVGRRIMRNYRVVLEHGNKGL